VQKQELNESNLHSLGHLIDKAKNDIIATVPKQALTEESMKKIDDAIKAVFEQGKTSKQINEEVDKILAMKKMSKGEKARYKIADKDYQKGMLEHAKLRPGKRPDTPPPTEEELKRDADSKRRGIEYYEKLADEENVRRAKEAEVVQLISNDDEADANGIPPLTNDQMNAIVSKNRCI
jgi:hypothetical protein